MTEENTQEQAATEAAQAPTETPAETTQHQETPEATEQHQETPTATEHPPETQEVELRTDANTAEAIAALSPEVKDAVLHAAVIGLEIGVDALGEAQAEVNKLRAALENCRMYAARHARREEWARTIGRFCEEAGVTGSPLRG